MKKKSASRKYNYFRLKDKLAVILSLLALALFVSKSLYNVPVGIMAILGLYRLATSPKQLWENPYIRIFVGLFLCFWLLVVWCFVVAGSGKIPARIVSTP